MFVPARDEPNYDIALKFIQCADFIDGSIDNGGRVLVHCFAGKSRCCAIIMGYLMLRKGMQFDQALDTCRSARPAVEPNLGFVAQLRALDRSLRRSRFTWFEKGKDTKADGEEVGQGEKKEEGLGEKNAVAKNTDDVVPGNNANVDAPPSAKAAFATPAPFQATATLLDSELHTDLHHVTSAASATPKGSPPLDDHHINNPKGFSRSATLTLDFSQEAGSLFIAKKNMSPEQIEKIRRGNERVASRACDRLYSKAMDQISREQEKRGQLSPEFTFEPRLNETSLQHALVAKARSLAKTDAAKGYMQVTEATKSLSKEQQRKSEAMKRRLEKTTARRFTGFGSIFYDSEAASPRDLGR